MRQAHVVGFEDVLEGYKNSPIVLREIRERMEQIHYGSPDTGSFPVIRPL